MNTGRYLDKAMASLSPTELAIVFFAALIVVGVTGEGLSIVKYIRED